MAHRGVGFALATAADVFPGMDWTAVAADGDHPSLDFLLHLRFGGWYMPCPKATSAKAELLVGLALPSSQ